LATLVARIGHSLLA